VIRRGARRLWRQRRAIVGLGAYVLAALVATEVVFLGAAELALASLDPWLSLVKASDLNLALSVYRRAAPALTFLFLGLTYLGSGWGNVVLATVGVSWLAARRMTLHAAALLYIMLGGWCLSELTKVLIGRARPEVVRLASATGYSFPSGHAVLSVCFYGGLALLLWNRARTRGWRALLLACAIGFPLAIGFSRVYLGVHYPTDVLGGWLGASLWLGAFALALRRWIRLDTAGRRPRSRR
jgi:membrane-associated phospholipid phosphatase